MNEVQHEGESFVAPAAGTLQAEVSGESRPAERAYASLDCRLGPINDYRVDTSDNPTKHAVALRAVSSDLMDYQAHLAEAIQDAVTDTPLSLMNLPEYVPSMDLAIRLAKQIAQFSQLEIRLAKPDKQKNK